VTLTSPGFAPSSPPGLDDTLGTFGTLLLLGELGRGAFGRVYRAWEPTLARQVALKVVDLDDDSPTLAAAVLEEGRLLARLRHPNIVTVHGALQLGHRVGVWMELVAGRTLADIVATDGPMSAEEAAIVGTSLCHALGAVHAIGLVHRDVKAQNVMREAGGRIVLMDFGAGRDLGSPALSHPGNVAGTPLYMAPERLLGHAATPACDLYSVGVLLYYLVTGRYPIEAATLQDLVVAHAQHRLTPLLDVRPDVPPAFSSVVERALAADPKVRYQSAGAMLRDLGGEPELRAPGLSPGHARRMPGPLRSSRARKMPRGLMLDAGLPPAEARAAVPAWRLWAAGALAAIPGVWALGFLTTMVFNVSLGREGRFAREPLADYWIWGARSLISPLLQMAAMLVVAWLAVVVWRAVRTLVPPAARLAERAGAAVVARARAIGLTTRTALAQLLVAAHVAALVAIVAGFSDLIAALTDAVGSTDPAMMSLLAPSDRHLDYRTALFVLLLATGTGWIALLQRPRDETRTLTPSADRGGAFAAALVAGAALLLVSVALAQMPFRVLWHAEFERVDLGGTRCYQTGQTDRQVLLFCPAVAPPRAVVVDATDARLVRRGVVENVFTRTPRVPAPPPPASEGSTQ